MSEYKYYQGKIANQQVARQWSLRVSQVSSLLTAAKEALRELADNVESSLKVDPLTAKVLPSDASDSLTKAWSACDQSGKHLRKLQGKLP